jgi:glycosyltransferase involved in cell wall biosynthesis
VQESLASGTPCVVPNTGGASDLISNNETGYVINTSDPLALIEAVNNYQNRSDRKEMQSAARNSVDK